MTTVAVARRSRLAIVAPVVATMHLLIGLLLAGRASLWGDEAFSAEAARLTWGELLSMLTRIDVNMSAYYLLLKAWTSVFGFSEFALRLPSLLMTTATVLIGSALVGRWFGERAGAVAAVALGLNPFFLLVGMTARPFAMFALLFTFSLGLFAGALGEQRLRPWVVLTAVDLLAFYTTLLASLVIATQVLYVVVADRRYRRGQFIAAALGLVGMIPALRYMAPSDTLSWLTTPTLRDFADAAWSSVGGVAGVLLAALALIGLVRPPQPGGLPLSHHPRSRLFLPAFVVMPVGLMVLLLPKQSLFSPPYLVSVLVASALLAGIVAAGLPETWSRAAAAALALTALVGLAVDVLPAPVMYPQDWRGAVAALDAEVRAGDAVVFPNTFYRPAAEHYARRGSFTDQAVPRLPDVPWFSEPPDTYDRLKRTGYYVDRPLIGPGVDDASRVWLVGPDDGFLSLFTEELTDAGWLIESEQDRAGVTTRLLVRSSSG